jgi:hypothetical protein
MPLNPQIQTATATPTTAVSPAVLQLTFPNAQQTATMNATIDRATARRQQQREQLVAAGTILVEDSSSIGIDLDRVDAFFETFSQRTYCSNFFRYNVNRYIRGGIYLMAFVVASIVLTPILRICMALGIDYNLDFTSAFQLARVVYVFVLMCILQPLGAGSMYTSNQLAEKMLPHRHGGDIIVLLLSGGCCFGDRILSRHQLWCLLAVQVSHTAGLYICIVAALLTLFVLSPPQNNSASTIRIIFQWIAAIFPAIAWYRFTKYMHIYYLERRESGLVCDYNVVTSDAVDEVPSGSRNLELV